jgi:DNA (cytosine-5)-methyltransferase 1
MDVVVADTIRVEYGEQSFRGDGADNLLLVNGVRRLTPLECERLMGWPDDHTRYTSDGQEISDSHRYRMCGNGMIATMAEWLGHRLVKRAMG